MPIKESLHRSTCDKEVFMRTAYAYIGKWYIWGGDDPDGFDCSGLVVECLKSAGVIFDKEDFTANRLWQAFKHSQVIEPDEGCLVFYFIDGGIKGGSDFAYHVGICSTEFHCINADGGNSKCKTIADAKKYDAFIKERPIDKRRGLRAFVNLF